MKTKIFKHIGVAALLVLTAACTEGDKFEYGDSENVAFISGTEITPVSRFVVEDTPATQIISVSTSVPVDKDTKVVMAIDPSKVEEYNAAHGTNFFCVPEGSAALDQAEVNIPAGKSFSDAIVVRMLSTENFEEGRTYVIPVTIKSIGVDVIESSRTIYLQIARVLHFTALDISNTGMYSNFIFPDNLKRELGAFTYEIKCYSKQWHRIARLCSFTSADEQKSSMLRFGENGYDVEQLQWVSPGGSIVSNTRFSTDRWYMISLVYDGNALIMYVDGEKDAEGATSGTVDFQRFELGMSWTSYPSSQYFRGYMAEVRVWDKALTPGQIKLGLCGVDPASDGLVAYWKMNEGEGHIFHDATGHGYDMDWSNTCREIREGAGLTYNLDYSSYVQWNSDDTNKCAE